MNLKSLSVVALIVSLSVVWKIIRTYEEFQSNDHGDETPSARPREPGPKQPTRIHFVATPPCSSPWGRFERNESLLTETQVIRRQFPPPKINTSTFDKSFDSFFFDPDANFAFCAIEKNACSQWQTVLRNVLEKRTSNGFNGPDYFIGERCRKRHGVEKLKQILESPNSTVAVMVRDPLARFASVYLNKCFDMNCTNGFCLPRARQKLPKGQPISFRHALDWVLGIDVAKVDGHYKLQSERCGMKNGGLEKYFTIVGKMTKETLPSDADCLMEYANISQYNIPAGSAGRREENTTFPLTFWTKGGGFKPKLNYRPEKEEDVLMKLYTKEAARDLMKKFSQDYDTFQLPEPKWIESATGEWMDSLNHHSCRSKVN